MNCPNCGNEIKEVSTFCTRCGTRLIPPKEGEAPRPVIQPKVAVPGRTPANTQTQAIPPMEERHLHRPVLENTAPADTPLDELGTTRRFDPESAELGATRQFSAQTPPPRRPQQKKKMGFFKRFFSKSKNIIITAAVAIALILLSVLIIVIASIDRKDYTVAKTTIRAIYDSETDDTFFAVDGKRAAFTVDGRCKKYTASIDGSVFVGEFVSGIYVVTAKKAVCVDELGYDAVLSDNGKYIMYRDENGNLCVYTVATADEIIISSENMFSYIFSPNGKYIVYAYYDDDDKFVLCKYSDGKSTHVGDGVMPVSVSDDGKYIYAYNMDSVLYCYYADKRVKISSNVMPYFFVNTDATEVGFFTDESKAYVSAYGGDKIKMFTSSVENNGYIYPVTDAHSDSVWRSVTSGYTNCIRTGMKSFADSYISQAGCIYYVDNNFNALLYVPSFGQRNALIYKDTIVYLSTENELCTMPLSDNGSFKVIAADASDYVATSNGRYVYFINDDGELWVYNGKKTQKLADDIDRLYVTNDDVVLFIQDYSSETGGTLCYSEGGRKPYRIAEDVRNVVVGADSVLYYANTEDGKTAVYSSDKGKKFDLVVEVAG